MDRPILYSTPFTTPKPLINHTMKVVNILKIADIHRSRLPEELSEAFASYGSIYQDMGEEEHIYAPRAMAEDARDNLDGIVLSDQGLDQLDALIALLDENDCSYVRFI
jgi:hypothetical protein